MNSAAGWRLALAAREPDQAGRLRVFRDAHPEVDIGADDFGNAYALIPAPRGSRYAGREIFGPSLRALLDKLDDIFPPVPETRPDG